MSPLFMHPTYYLCLSSVSSYDCLPAVLFSDHLLLIAVICTIIGSECLTACYSWIWPRRPENVLQSHWLKFTKGNLQANPLLISHSNTCSVFFLSPFRWLFNKTACTVYAFCGVLFGLCSLTNLTVLSCVCWLKVCCPNYGNNTSF